MLAYDKIHQIEIVAAFFNESSTSSSSEAIPVIYLGIERFAMFADGDMVDIPDFSGFRALNDFIDRWHKSIFEPHPGKSLASISEIENLFAICRSCSKWLLDKDCEIGSEHITKHFNMCVIRSCDDDGIDEARAEHRVMVGKYFRIWCEGQGRLLRGHVRVTDRRNGDAIHDFEVLNMLAPHAACTDNSVPQKLAHRPQVRPHRTKGLDI